MTINEQELQEVFKALDDLQKTISDRKTRRKVMRKPAKIVVDKARRSVPVGKRIHYRYSTPKIIKNKRAAKGSGVIVATYHPGNLRKSVKRLNFRKSAREFIGPKLGRGGRNKGEFGLSATRVDAYYAAAMAGSAVRFRKMFLEPALNETALQALKLAEKAIADIIRKRNTGL